MQNPEIFTVAVGDTPTLLFSGCGNVRAVKVSGAGSPAFGGPAVDRLNAATFFSEMDSATVTFKANAEVYAACQPGQSAVIRVERWF